MGLALLAVTFGLVFTGSVLTFDQEGVEALQHNKEVAQFIDGLGGWFTPDFSRSAPLPTRLSNGHVTILPLLFAVLIGIREATREQHRLDRSKPADDVAGIGVVAALGLTLGLWLVRSRE